MKRNSFKILLIVVVSLSILALGAFVVSAQIMTAYPPIVQKLAEKFNLNPNEVNKVFQEQRTEMHQRHRAHLEERLTTAVEEGKITEEQKQAILKKMDEIKGKMEKLRDLPAAERREALRSLRQELKDWAKDNNIDLGLIGCGPGMHGPGGPMGEGHMGQGMHGPGAPSGTHMGQAPFI